VGGVFRGRIWDSKEASKFSPGGYLARTAYSNRWRHGLPLRHRNSIFSARIKALAAQRADVLATHEPPGLHRPGKSAFTYLARAMGERRAFRGHVHEMNTGYLGNMWVGLSLHGIIAMDTQTYALTIVERRQDQIHRYELERSPEPVI
jgi:hypothetical protein